MNSLRTRKGRPMQPLKLVPRPRSRQGIACMVGRLCAPQQQSDKAPSSQQ